MFSQEKYGALLATTLPMVIETEEENERFLAIIESLMKKGEGNLSPEEEKLLVLLANLVEDFESKAYPIKDAPPHEILQFLMEEHNLKQKDLLDIFGSSGIASEVCQGKRQISKTQAKKLAERFKVSADLFI